MRVLVTGAAGVLGSNLVGHLQASGIDDLVTTDVSTRAFEGKKDTRFVAADLADERALGTALEGIDTVVHCASAAPSYSREEIEAIVVEGTERLLNLSAASGSVRRFVYVSSTAVYGIPTHCPVDEDDPLQPFHDPYNRAKIAAEAHCRSYRSRGLVVPILRPRTFVGPGRMGTFAMLNDWASAGKHFPLLGSGTNRYQLLDVADLCEAIRLTCTLPDTVVDDVFNIGASRFGTMREDYQAVLDEAGFGRRVVPLPARPVLWTLRALERAGLSPLYKRLYEKLQMDYHVSVDRARARLGFEPSFSNEQSLVRCYRWYRQHREEHEITRTGKSNAVPWNQGLLRYGKVFF